MKCSCNKFIMKKCLSLLLCLFFLTGCSSAGASPEYAGDMMPCVTDASGQVHVVPDNTDELTIASVYAVSVPFITALDLSERVLAINVKSRFWTDSVPGLAKAGSVGRGVVDLEALAEFAPDVLIHRSNDAATIESVTGILEIPVLCIEVENYDDILKTLEMMGTYFGVEKRAADVSNWLTGKFEIIDDIVRQIPESGRVSAVVMGSQPFRVAGGDMLQSWMIEKAGGISLTADITNNRNWADIGVEMMFELNPDFIFCTGSTVLDYSVQQLLDDNAWSAMTAVINENIFDIPARLDSWDLPGISSALGTMFMLHTMYPGYFPLESLLHEIDEYYMFMFGRTFDSNYLGFAIGR